MDHVLWKTQLDYIISRVLNSRQPFLLCRGLQGMRLAMGFVRGFCRKKVGNWMPTLWEAGLACCMVGCHPQTWILSQSMFTVFKEPFADRGELGLLFGQLFLASSVCL